MWFWASSHYRAIIYFKDTNFYIESNSPQTSFSHIFVKKRRWIKEKKSNHRFMVVDFTGEIKSSRSFHSVYSHKSLCFTMKNELISTKKYCQKKLNIKIICRESVRWSTWLVRFWYVHIWQGAFPVLQWYSGKR